MKLEYHKLLSAFAFKFNLRHYNQEALIGMTVAANQLVASITYEGEAARVGRALEQVAAGLSAMTHFEEEAD